MSRVRLTSVLRALRSSFTLGLSFCFPLAIFPTTAAEDRLVSSPQDSGLITPSLYLSSFSCPAWRHMVQGACVGSMREWSIPYRDYTQPADRVRTAPSQRWSLSTVPVAGERRASRIAQPAARGTLAATMSRASRNPGKVNAKNDRCRCLRLFERHVLSTIQLLDLARRPRRNSDAHTRCLAGERLRWQTRSRYLVQHGTRA